MNLVDTNKKIASVKLFPANRDNLRLNKLQVREVLRDLFGWFGAEIFSGRITDEAVEILVLYPDTLDFRTCIDNVLRSSNLKLFQSLGQTIAFWREDFELKEFVLSESGSLKQGTKKILVTGGAGFIGSNLVDKLIELGHQVAVIDNLSSGKREYLNPQAKFYEVDICDKASIAKIFESEKFDYVYHLAAQIDVRISVADPELDNKINVLGGLNILENCNKNKVKKILFVSTGGAIYGETELMPTDESHPAYPLSPYGIHKLTFEKYLKYYFEVYGQDYTIFRLANVYGPRQYKGGEAGVVSIFVDFAVNGKKLTINGDGLQTRDFVFVGDVVNALVAGLDNTHAGEINIGTGKETNLIEIVEAIEAALGRKIEREHTAAKPGEQRRSALHHGKAKEVLGWQPTVGLHEGIKKSITWTSAQSAK